MLLAHDSIDERRVFEGQEGKASRPIVLVTENRAVLNLTKLCEILPETLWTQARSISPHATMTARQTITVGGIPTEAANKHFAVWGRMRFDWTLRNVPYRV